MSDENHVRRSTITKETLLPVSLIMSLTGIVFMFATMYSQGNANAKALEEYTKTIQKIDRRLSRMEGKMQIKDMEPIDGE